MSAKRKTAKFLTIALLSGVGLSAPFVLHHVQVNVMAQAKVHTTVTKGETVIYNNKNIKSGKHYIPEGIRINYEFKPEGIQVWATGKNPKGFLKNDKDHEFMATYASLPQLGISPSEAQKDKYEAQQKQVNKKMKKSGINTKKVKKVPGTKTKKDNHKSKPSSDANNNNSNKNKSDDDLNNSSNDSDNSNSGDADNDKQSNQSDNKDNPNNSNDSGQADQDNDEGDSQSDQGDNPSSSADSSKNKSDNENRAALNAQKEKYAKQLNQMKKQFGNELKHQKEEDALKDKEQQLNNKLVAAKKASPHPNNPNNKQLSNSQSNNGIQKPQKDQTKAEGRVLPRTNEVSRIVNSLIAMITAGSAYLIDKGFKKEK